MASASVLPPAFGPSSFDEQQHALYSPYNPREPGSMISSLRQKLSRGRSPKSTSQTDLATGQTASRQPTLTMPGNNPFKDVVDAPPAYSEVATSSGPAPFETCIAPPATAPGADDPFAFLSTFDTVFLVDDSGSMAGSRWRDTLDALATITPICTAHDSDGIDIRFLNAAPSPSHSNVTSSSAVREIFSAVRPRGCTPTGQRLNALLRPYLRRYEAAPDSTKPINIICITDGEPSDDVESPLIAAAKKLDKLDAPAWQVGVQFFQVGNDEAASSHLRQLDDELAQISGDDDLRDIVDTVPFVRREGQSQHQRDELSGEGILKVVLGAVNRRLDRKKGTVVHRRQQTQSKAFV